MTYEKVGDSILRKTETVDQVTDVLYDTLLDRRAAFVVSRDYIDAQIADIDAQISQAESLGLKTQAQVTAEMEAAIAADAAKSPG